MDRRQYIGTLSLAGVGALAGCIEDIDETPIDTSGGEKMRGTQLYRVIFPGLSGLPIRHG